MTHFYDYNDNEADDDDDAHHHHHHDEDDDDHHFDHNLCQGELGDTLLWELLEQLNLQHLVAVGGLEATV